MTGPVVLTPLTGIPEVRLGDDLAALVVDALVAGGVDLLDGDVLVVSSKVLSKAAGLRVSADGDGDADADSGADGYPAVRQALIEAESARVVAERVSPTGLTQVVQAHAGPVMAAAGVDASNTGAADVLLTLPRDADAAADDLRETIERRWRTATGHRVRTGLVVSDTAGRPWRVGQTDFALGASGVSVMEDLRGSLDADGRDLQVTERCLADEIAAAADLVKGKVAGIPVAHVRGIPVVAADPAALPGARSLVRTGPQDWFGLGRVEAVRSALGVGPGTALARRVGIASTAPEPIEVRLRRAVAVASTPPPSSPSPTPSSSATAEVVATACGAGDAGWEAVVSATDAFDAGALAARVVVALAAEGLTAQIRRPDPALPTAVIGPVRAG